MRNSVWAPIVIGAMSFVVAGCGSSSSSSTPASTASSTQASTSTSSPSSSSSGGGQVVKLSADPSGALKFTQTSLTANAGKVTVQMTNPSTSGVQHGIAIEGHGVDQDGPIVQPGATSPDTVTLKPGTYKYYCPFDSHEQQGMTGTLTVK
jgi:plastocyanin